MVFRNLTGYEEQGTKERRENGHVFLDGGEEPDLAVAVSFGAELNEDDKPEEEVWINEKIAEAAALAADLYDVPVFAQSEIADYLGEMDEEREFYNTGGRVSEEDSRFSYTDTWEVVDESLQRAERYVEDPGEVLYISHPAHMQRVKDTGEFLGEGEASAFTWKETEWYSKNPQWWVKNRELWATRELFARTFYRVRKLRKSNFL